MAPTHDSRQRSRFTRPTAMNDSVIDDTGLPVRADGQAAEVRVANAPVDLASRENRHFVPVDQSDPPAEVGQDIRIRPETVREDVAALEKEGALLRKEQRKSRQVRTAGIDLGFGEVGIDRGRREHVGAGPLRHVEAWLKVALQRRGRRLDTAPAGDGRPDAQAETEIEIGQLGQQTRATGLRQAGTAGPVTPSDPFPAGAESAAAR